jgi:hypothetical protein
MRKLNPTEKLKKADKKDTLSASQRLLNLEMVVNGQAQYLEKAQNAFSAIDSSLKNLAQVIDAMIDLLAKGEQVTQKAIQEYITEKNVQNLKANIDTLAKEGFLAPAEVIDEKSYVVVEEYDKTGGLVQPRLQFPMSSTEGNEALRNKLLGAKVGDLIVTEENQLDMKITEVFVITEPSQK